MKPSHLEQLMHAILHNKHSQTLDTCYIGYNIDLSSNGPTTLS